MHAYSTQMHASVFSARDVFVSFMPLLSAYLYYLGYEEGEHPGATVCTHKMTYINQDIFAGNWVT